MLLQDYENLIILILVLVVVFGVTELIKTKLDSGMDKYRNKRERMLRKHNRW